MSQKGFTLVEVLIATSILAVSIITINAAWSGNFLRIRKSKSYNLASSLLQEKITEMELKFKDRSFNNIPDKLEGDFGSERKNYRWTFESQDFEMPDLKTLVSQGQDEALDETTLTILSQMKNFFDKSIKEARVTVYQKIRKKEKKFSVSFYFVDYNQELSLLGGG